MKMLLCGCGSCYERFFKKYIFKLKHKTHHHDIDFSKLEKLKKSFKIVAKT
jgi:hypothetical protein